MPINLETPITNDRTVSINFFNGRLLSGEDLTTEQTANRAAHQLLGQALGSGIVRGLEVQEALGSSSVNAPVLSVKAGVAINRTGHVLLLNEDAQVALVRPPEAASGTSLFKDCEPPQGGAYVAAAGVYLLVLSPISTVQGSAVVTGLGNVASTCNSKYRADAVQFRLLQMDVPGSMVADPNKIRNLVSYGCFEAPANALAVERPFGPAAASSSLLDALRPTRLTNCDVPLCVLYWTATGGVRFIDMWAVRRRVTHRSATGGIAPVPGDDLTASHESMIWQFQAHLADLLSSAASPQTLHATDYFRYLPPAGLLPLQGGAFSGIDPLAFFAGKTQAGPYYIDGPRVPLLLRLASAFPPIDLTTPEMLRGYWVRENIQAFQQPGTAAAPYLMFASGYIPYMGEPYFNLSQWGYANLI